MTEAARTESGRPLRLLCFSHSPHLAGSEQVLLQLVRELTTEHGVACTVVLPTDGALAPRLREAGAEARIWSLPWWCSAEELSTERVRRYLAAGAAALITGLADLATTPPDAVLSITTVMPWGGLAAALLGRPHLWYVTDFGREQASPPRYFLDFNQVLRSIRTGSDRVVAVSEAVRDRLFPEAHPAPEVVYPHVDLPADLTERAAQANGSTVRATVFGTVRRAKGHWDAVDALAALTRRGVDLELRVVGGRVTDGGVDELVEYARRAGVAGSLRFTGFVENQHACMADTDIVLVPSHDETFSLVSLEALLHGRPLVATRVGGIPEFVHDRENGLLVPPNDPEALADAIETLVRNPALAARLAERGRRDSRERFTAEAFGDRFRHLLDEMVLSGRRCDTPAAFLAPLDALAAEAAERHRLEIELGEAQRSSERLRRVATREEARRQQAMSQAQERLQREEIRSRGLERELVDVRRTLQAQEEELRRRRESVRRITETRAWRLINLYWRLVRRLPWS